ncbi:MAG: hypothetical protein AB7K52_09065 [Phycisphaerales bacterium]
MLKETGRSRGTTGVWRSAGVAMLAACMSATCASGQGTAPKEPPIDLESMARAPSSSAAAGARTEAASPAASQQPASTPTQAATPAAPSEAARPADQPEEPATDALSRQGVRTEVRSVSGPAGDVETRKVFPAIGGTLIDKWRSPAKAGDESSSILDVRTGLRGSISLTFDQASVVRLGRLTRARLGAISTGGDEPSATRGLVELVRGSVSIWPAPGVSINVLTPEGVTVVRDAATVSHDSVHGTRVSVLTEPAPAAQARPEKK